MDVYLRQDDPGGQDLHHYRGHQFRPARAGDGMLVEMYAAYLYRRRREENVAYAPDAEVGAEQPAVLSQKARATAMDDVSDP